MAHVLRDYQDKATCDIFTYFEEKTGSPLVVIPTAGGKALIIAEFVKRALTMYPGTKILNVSHVVELIEQNAKECSQHYPELFFTFCNSTLGKKNLMGDVVFATIQSIYKNSYDFQSPPDLLLIDEAHLLSHSEDTMYRKFIADLLRINPNLKVIGFTASPYRADHGMLHEGDGRLFTDICHETPVLDLINKGYLSPVITPENGVRTKMSTKGVGTSKGDYIAGQLERAVDVDEITVACVDEIMEHSVGRKKWIIFTAGIKHCTHVRDEIRRRGVICEMVHGKTPKAERRELIERFKNGDIKCLVNVCVFTTGFNVQAIDLIGFMRPTRSPVMYVQCVGRGMRLFPQKENCLLLDFGGVVESLGPIDSIRIKKKQSGEGEAPTKMCQHCGHECHAAALICENCGAGFPAREIDIEHNASTAAVLSTQIKAEWRQVDHVSYYRHKKEGKPDSLRVDYLCGFKAFREWVCIEHSNDARVKAARWWRQASNSPSLPIPNTIAEALSRTHELKKPTEISVKKVGAYFEVLGEKYDDTI